jgi:hypothetical protein
MLVSLGCSRSPITESYARQLAQDSFSRVCTSYHLSGLDYDGPMPTTVGGAAFAFEWRHKSMAQRGVLISITKDGDDEVAFLEKGP